MWQKIDSAPKDGTKILCWCGEYADICYYEAKHPYGMVWTSAGCEDFGGYETPTHWMPLPTPPTTQGERNGN